MGWASEREAKRGVRECDGGEVGGVGARGGKRWGGGSRRRGEGGGRQPAVGLVGQQPRDYKGRRAPALRKMFETPRKNADAIPRNDENVPDTS